MITNRFGRIITGFDVAQAVRATLVAWMPDYIADISDQSGRDRTGPDALSPFRAYFYAHDLDRFDEQQLPACVLYVPETVNVYQARRKSSATWDVRIGSFVKGKNNDLAYETGMLYAAAVRAILVQKSGLGGDPRRGEDDPPYEPFAESVQWVRERYDLIDTDDQRTLGASVGMFTVTVEDVVSSGHGPTEPSGDPSQDPGPWPTVDPTKINITVEAKE